MTNERLEYDTPFAFYARTEYSAVRAWNEVLNAIRLSGAGVLVQ